MRSRNGGPATGLTKCPLQNADWIGRGVMADRLDHRRTRGIHIYGQSGLAVRQTHSHSI